MLRGVKGLYHLLVAIVAIVWFRFPSRKLTVVGVTGTRGKSTTTHLIHHCLTSAGKRAHLGGNVRDVSTLALVPHMEHGDILVLELGTKSAI